MNIKPYSYIFPVLIFCSLLFPIISHAKEVGSCIFLSNFEGPEYLGKNIATLMNLEIGYKLEGSNFHKNKIIRWKVINTKISSHEQALRAAKQHNANFILWGHIFHYGNSFIIQPYLSISELDIGNNTTLGVWQVAVKTKNQNIKISTDNPEINPANRLLIFSPIILNSKIVKKYSSANALKFSSREKAGRSTDSLRDDFIIEKIEVQNDRRSAQVKSAGKVGQLDFPPLSGKENEVYNFVAGMLLLFVNDRNAGTDRLQSIEQINDTPTGLKIDSLLFQAAANAKSGFGVSTVLKRAYKFNPYYRPTIAYKIINAFSDLNKLLYKSDEVDNIRSAILSISELINSNRYLFSANDPWFKNVQISLGILEAEHSLSLKNNAPPIKDKSPIDGPESKPPDIDISKPNIKPIDQTHNSAPPLTPNEPDKPDYLWKADRQANIQGEVKPWESWVRWEDSRFARVFLSRKAIQMDGNQIRLVFRGNKFEDYFISMVSIAQKKPDGKIGEIVESTWKEIYFESKGEKIMWDNKILVPHESIKTSGITSFEFTMNADYYVTFFIEGPSDFVRYYPEEESASEKEPSLFFDFYDEKQDKTDFAEKKHWVYDESVDTDYTIIALDSIVPGYYMKPPAKFRKQPLPSSMIQPPVGFTFK